MTRNDVLWKGLIEAIFPYFIPFFLPQFQHLFNLLGPVEFLDKELQELNLQPDADGEMRFVDKLVKVPTTDGNHKWILIHIEVQGYNDADFTERMYTYFYRIRDRYGINVTAIAIFTDNNKKFLPNQYVYDFAGTTNMYTFNTYKVLLQDEQELSQSNNPFAIAILTVLLALKKKKLDDDNLLKLKLDLIRHLRSRGFSQQVVRNLFAFIRKYVNFAKPETAAKFETEIESLTNNNKPMDVVEMVMQMERKEGLIEGEMKGEIKGSRKKEAVIVENLLRSTDFSDEKIAYLAEVSPAFVAEVRAKFNSN